jgi:amino acid permease
MNLSLKKFYLFGMIIFFIVSIGGIINFYYIFKFLNIGSFITTVGGIVFNIILFLLFYSLYKQTPDEFIQNQNLDNLINEKEKTRRRGARLYRR